MIAKIAVALLILVVVYFILGFFTFVFAKRRGQVSRDAIAAFAAVVLWPFILVLCFRTPMGTEDPSKALIGIRRCSARIRFTALSDSEPHYGRFIFKARDVEEVLARGRYPSDYRQWLEKWINSRDEGDETISDVPSVLQHSFSDVISDLILENRMESYCLKCASTVESPDLAEDHFKVSGGWNTNSYMCGSGHLLYSVRTLHILVKPPGIRNA